MTYADLVGGVAIGHKKTSLLTAVVLAALAGSAVASTTAPGWVGWMPSTVSQAESAVVWMPSVGCLLAAWLAGQPRSHGYSTWAQTSSRSTTARTAAPYATAAVCVVLAQLVQVIWMGVVSARYGMEVPAEQAVLLLSVPTMTAYLLTWVGIGVWLGRSIRREVALPLCAVLPYAAYAASVYSSPTAPLSAVALGDGRVFDYVRPGTDLLIARGVLWAVAAVLAAACALGARRTRRVAAWVTSAALAATVFVGPSYGPLTGATNPACQGSAPTVCLDNSHASVLPRYRAALNRLWPNFPEPLRPDVVTSDPSLLPAGHTGRVLVAPPLAGTSSPSRIVDQTKFAAEVGDVTFLGACTAQSPGGPAAIVLALWWRLTQHVPVGQAAYLGDGLIGSVITNFDQSLTAARQFAAGAADGRAAWFDVHAAQVSSCTAPVPTAS